MARDYRCGYCRQDGHNKRACPERKRQRELVLAEVGDDLKQRDAKIGELQQKLDAESARSQQVTVEHMKLEEELKIEKAKRKAVLDVLRKEESREQSVLLKIISPTIGAVGSGLTFLGQRFDRIPHAEKISLCLLFLIPGLLVFAGAEYTRRWLTRRLVQERVQHLAATRDG